MGRYVDITKIKFPCIGFDDGGDALVSIRVVKRILEEAACEEEQRCKECNFKTCCMKKMFEQD